MYITYLTIILMLIASMLLSVTGSNISNILNHEEQASIQGELSAVKLSVFTPDGNRIYYIESEKLVYFPQQETASLRPVNVLYTTQKGTTMNLASESGNIFDAGARIKLNGKVHINWLPEQENILHTGETSELEINTQTEYATSNEYATITKGSQTVSGQGIKIDLSNRKINILRNVVVHNSPT